MFKPEHILTILRFHQDLMVLLKLRKKKLELREKIWPEVNKSCLKMLVYSG
jgi:hypothetical protein